MRLAFVWHWPKATVPELSGAFAASDTLLTAIARLTAEGHDARVFALVNAHAKPGEMRSADGIVYEFSEGEEALVAAIKAFAPEAILFSHNPRDYSHLVRALKPIGATIGMYLSAIARDLPTELLQLDFYLVHHDYQGRDLAERGIDAGKIDVAPKTADLDLFRPDPAAPKQWDCIYPSRGSFGYLKRLELAAQACAIARATLVIPGASVPGTLSRPARHAFPLLGRRFPMIMDRASRRVGGLNPFPWITTLPWQDNRGLARIYSQARCLVMTTNDIEMGPRAIPEAVACNLPFVVCADSRACVSHARALGGYIAEPEPRDVAAKIRLALADGEEWRSRLERNGLGPWVIYDALRRRLLGREP